MRNHTSLLSDLRITVWEHANLRQIAKQKNRPSNTISQFPQGLCCIIVYSGTYLNIRVTWPLALFHHAPRLQNCEYIQKELNKLWLCSHIKYVYDILFSGAGSKCHQLRTDTGPTNTELHHEANYCSESAQRTILLNKHTVVRKTLSGSLCAYVRNLENIRYRS